jgi:hypothetical protein
MARLTRKSKKSQDAHLMSQNAASFATDLTVTSGKQIVWSQLRDRIVVALENYPEAREALVRKLMEDLGLTSETRIQP